MNAGAESAVKVSPAVFAGTLVQEGQARMLVLAVGANTYQGLMEEKMREVCVNVVGREEEGVMRLRCESISCSNERGSVCVLFMRKRDGE